MQKTDVTLELRMTKFWLIYQAISLLTVLCYYFVNIFK